MIVLASKKFARFALVILGSKLFSSESTFAQEQNALAISAVDSATSRREDNHEDNRKEATDAVAATAPQWLSIGEDYAVDKNSLATTNRWLTAHFVLSNNEGESYGGVLAAKKGNENLRGTAAGGVITLTDLRWLRRVDAAVYQFNNANQWEGGAHFAFLDDRIELQLQHNVFLWWRELSAEKLVLNAHIPIAGANAELNWQHYAVSDGNTVQDTTVRIDIDELLRTPQSLHWRVGFHKRSATFSNPDYWSPTAAETTLELGAGLTWQRPRWQFAFSARRNFGLNQTTAASWSIDSTFTAKIDERLSMSVVYENGNGRPQRDAFWWQFLSATLKWNL